MELKELTGNIIGIITNNMPKKEDYNSTLVKDIIKVRLEDSLKMVGLETSVVDKSFKDLSSGEKNKVILASKLNDKDIILIDFSKGLTKKEISFFKRLFKKIVTYNKKIYLYSTDAEIFINCVDNIYVINNDNVLYSTSDIFDPALYMDIDTPEIVNFIYKCQDLRIRLDEYKDINDLIKAIYRIKS